MLVLQRLADRLGIRLLDYALRRRPELMLTDCRAQISSARQREDRLNQGQVSGAPPAVTTENIGTEH